MFKEKLLRFFPGAVFLILVLYWFRAPVLTGAARCLRVEDSLVKADCILVLSGDPATRVPAAAQLFHDGWAPSILLTHPELPREVRFPFVPLQADVAQNILQYLDVPKEVISILPGEATSTYDEAVSLRRYVNSNPEIKRIILVTTAFHTRRARWICRKALKGVNVRLLACPAEHGAFHEQNWWQNERGLIEYFNEYVKGMLYLWRYALYPVRGNDL
jgi:uncharacterized SAM-binding protein YcdF (DUF218 family)